MGELMIEDWRHWGELRIDPNITKFIEVFTGTHNTAFVVVTCCYVILSSGSPVENGISGFPSSCCLFMMLLFMDQSWIHFLVLESPASNI